ncbi:MAG: hypothetical protein NTX86_03750 [Candidatus Dependentiae bacterium]|nr:hypothetical protein [Candidatus Dependentiae bacterium]
MLLWWGLPISLLSPIGNLIFGPVLTLFLSLSSLLFFTEMLYIPNGWIAKLLDWTTQAWLYVLNIDGHPWLYGFAKPSLAILIIIPVLALCVIQYKRFTNTLQSVVCLGLLLIGSCLYLKTNYAKTESIEELACNKGTLTILHDSAGCIVIDPGVIGQKIAAASWTEYTLAPHLIKTSGKTTIDCLILLQPTAMLFDAVTALVTKVKVNTIYLIYWEGLVPKKTWHSFFAMRRALEAQGIPLKRIGNKELTLRRSDRSCITITPLKQTIKQQEITYPAIKVHGFVADKIFECHSYKFKNPTQKP